MSGLNNVPRIHALPRELADQIAAGEVVERPASVVKELLENAIDARADHIRIDLERGGITRIRITDNGHGIHPDDLRQTLDRHSTSKLSEGGALQRVQTLGFRGEALGAIASVSRMTIQSSCDDSGQGLEMQCSGSSIEYVMPVAHRAGTTVEVRTLFFNTPARRKFLRTEWTEYQHVQYVIRQIALSHFSTGFHVTHNGRKVMTYPAVSADYARRVAAIAGQEFIHKARPLDYSAAAFHLWGWLGDPAIARNQSDRQYLYLNGRAIRDKHLNHAIRVGYADRIYPGRYPCYVLFLEMDPALADINVHPAKHEVRFAHTRDVHDFIHAAVADTLTAGRVPEPAVAGDGSHSAKVAQEINTVEVRESGGPLPATGSLQTQPAQIRAVLQGRFLIFEDAQATILFDLQAARMTLARLALAQVRAGHRVVQKPLLLPVSREYPRSMLDKLEDRLDMLAVIGVDVVRQAPDSIMLRQLPAFLEFADAAGLFDDLVAALDRSAACDDDIDEIVLGHVNDRQGSLTHEDLCRIIDAIMQTEYTGARTPPVYRRLSADDLLALLGGR